MSADLRSETADFRFNIRDEFQVRQTGFLVYFELDFYCLCSLQKSISKLMFAGLKSSSSNFIFQTLFFKNQVQIDRALESAIE